MCWRGLGYYRECRAWSFVVRRKVRELGLVVSDCNLEDTQFQTAICVAENKSIVVFFLFHSSFLCLP